MDKIFPTIDPPDCIAIDVETTGIGRDAEIVSAAVSWYEYDSNEPLSIGFWLDRYSDNWKNEDNLFKQILRSTLFNTEYKGTVVFHHAGFDLKLIMIRYYERDYFFSDELCKIADTMSISRLSKNNKYLSHTDPLKLKCHSLKFLAKEFLGYDHSTFESVTSGVNINLIDPSKILAYNRKDAEVTIKLYKIFLHSFLEKSSKASTPRLVGDYYKNEDFPHTLNVFHVNWYGQPYNVQKAEEWLNLISDYKLKIETEIFNATGRWFNIGSGRDLAKAIFHNPRLRYRDWRGELRAIDPYYETEKGQTRVDIDTWVSIKNLIKETDKQTSALKTLDQLIQYSELTKTETAIERHLSFVVNTKDGPRVYPNFTADALSGRIKCSRPNFMGLSKLLHKKSDAEDTPELLRNFSIRHLIYVHDEASYTIASADIIALDPSVVAHGAIRYNDNSIFKEIFKKRKISIDLHLAIAQIVMPDKYRNMFSQIVTAQYEPTQYWVTKPKDSKIQFIDKITDEPSEFVLLSKEEEEEVKRVRGVWKVFNLMVSYISGATTTALKLKEETKRPVSIYEAQEMLDKFYDKFPEVRMFQDDIANQIYRNGYATSVFGKNFYANVFDDLNEHCRQAEGHDRYQFICKIKGRYWLIECENWEKEDLVLENLKWLESPGCLKFKNISRIQELDAYIFRKSKRIKKKSKFNRKSEENLDETLDYELSRIQITDEIDKQRHLPQSWSSDGKTLFFSLIDSGNYAIPEKYILFYRVMLRNPSSQYFKVYKSLTKVARKFFPLFCQGVATSLAKKCFTQIRTRIDELKLDAKIIMPLHDQFEVEVRKDQAHLIDSILVEAIASDKYPFNIPLTCTLEEHEPHLHS